MFPIKTRQTASLSKERSTLRLLYNRKIRSAFKAWTFVPLGIAFLVQTLDPLVDKRTGLWIAFWFTILSIGVTSYFFVWFYGVEIKKTRSQMALSETLKAQETE